MTSIRHEERAPPQQAGTPFLVTSDSDARVLRKEVAGAQRVDRDARAHRRGEGDLLQVPALRRRRLGAEDVVQRGRVVLDQLLSVEGSLADRQVKVGLVVDAEVDLT